MLKPGSSRMCVPLSGEGAPIGWNGRPRSHERHCDDDQLSVMGSVETTVSARAEKLSQCEPLLWGRSGG